MVNYWHMNANMMWLPISEARAEIVRVAAVLMLGMMAVAFVGSLAKTASLLDHYSADPVSNAAMASVSTARAHCD
jgi:hypothetical protein